jgi:hypothetical protein
MDLNMLRDSCKALGLKNIEAYYHGKFTVWLENKSEQKALSKAFVKTIWTVGKVITKIVPIESKALSPYIVVRATM